MSPEFNNPQKPEFIVRSTSDIIKHDIDVAGSVARYINIVHEAFEEQSKYRSNLLQLERMARVVTYDQLALPDDNHNSANGFYWGGILGLALGDYVHSKDWSALSYEGISAAYYSAADRADDERQSRDDTEYTSPHSTHPIDTADILIGELEISDEPIPEEYMALIDTCADELTYRPQTKAFIINGFKFVAIHAFQHEHMIREARREAREKDEQDALLALYDFDPDLTD
jgi:hypothetical protein